MTPGGIPRTVRNEVRALLRAADVAYLEHLRNPESAAVAAELVAKVDAAKDLIKTARGGE